MSLVFTWQSIPALLTIALTLALAALLLYLDFQKRANRAFAVLLVLRAIALLMGSFRTAATTDAEFEFYQRMIPYFQLSLVPAMLYFLVVYPRPRTWFGKSRWGGWTILAASFALEALYAFDHGLYWSYEKGVAASAILNAGGGFRYTDFGPLVAIGQLSVPMTCVAAIVLARDYIGERAGGARFSLVLIVAGLVLSGLFFGTQWFFATGQQLLDAGGYPWLPWGWSFIAMPMLTAPLAVAALVVIVVGTRRTKSAEDDREARRLLILSPLPILAAVWLASLGTDIFGDPLAVFAIGLFRLLMPLLITYALLRYRLFDLDFKARVTIHYGSVVAAFGVVYFFVSELAEGVVSDQLSALIGVEGIDQWAGLGAAAGLALFVKPLERAAGRFAHRVMPGARPLEELDPKERQRLYQDQFAMALQDGRLTANEKRMLADLQKKLGLVAPPAAAAPRRGSASRTD